MTDEEARQQMAMAQAQHIYKTSVDAIVALGREDMGTDTFDHLAQELVGAIGVEKREDVMVSVMQCDAPTRVIQHLAENPDRAKKISDMSPARRAAELGRIEAQLMPSGGDFGAEPAWMARARGGSKTGLGDDLSDAQWEKNFRRKYPDGWVPPSVRRYSGK